MLILFCCMAFFLSIITFWFELKRRSYCLIFPALFAFMVPFAIIIQSTNESLNYNVLLELSMWSFAFSGVYIISRVFFLRIMKVNPVCILEEDLENRLVLFVFSSIFILYFLVSLANFEFSYRNLVTSGWAEARGRRGFIDLITSYLAYISSFLFIYMFAKTSKRTMILFFFYIIYVVFVLKARNMLILLVAPVMTYYFINNYKNFVKLIKFFIFSLSFVFLYFLARLVRHAGSIDSLSLDLSQVMGEAGELSLILHAYEYILATSGTKLSGFDQNNTVIFVFSKIFGIPEGIQDVTKLWWNFKTGLPFLNGSLHPTIIGDAIMSNQRFGYLISPIFLALLFSLSEKIASINSMAKVTLLPTLAFVSFYFSRGATINGMFILLFAMLFSILLIGMNAILWSKK